MDADHAIRRAVELLTQTARARRIPQREIQKALGVSEGWMRGLVTGRFDPRLRHLLKMLDVLEVDPVAFFRAVFDNTEEGEAVQRLIGRPAEPPAPVAPAPVTFADLRQWKEEIIQEFELRFPAKGSR